MSPEVFGDEGDNERFDRPRRNTRPRTKERPSYPNAVPGFVVTVDRGRLTVSLQDGGAPRTVFAVKARHLGRKGVVVGDNVRVVGDSSGDEGSLARIVEVTVWSVASLLTTVMVAPAGTLAGTENAYRLMVIV